MFLHERRCINYNMMRPTKIPIRRKVDGRMWDRWEHGQASLKHLLLDHVSPFTPWERERAPTHPTPILLFYSTIFFSSSSNFKVFKVGLLYPNPFSPFPLAFSPFPYFPVSLSSKMHFTKAAASISISLQYYIFQLLLSLSWIITPFST